MNEQIIKLVQQVAAQLQQHNAHLLTVESCTGGGVGYYCTSQTGSSAWYHCGYITYQNSVKQELGVPEDILEKYGAVSEQTALAMAEAALNDQEQRSIQTFYSLSITGIAGPDGGSAEKPVGTVCFAWAADHLEFVSETKVFQGDRNEIRDQAIVHALAGLLKFIQETPTA